MPDSVRVITDPEEVLDILEKAMTFSEFGQYVKNNIPYDQYVFGVGRVRYTPIENVASDSLLILEPDSETDVRKDPWFWGGAAYSGFSCYKSWVAFDQYNCLYWKGANGGRFGQNIISNLSKDAYGINFYKNSAKTAAAKAKPLNNVAKKLSYVSLIIPIASSVQKGKANAEDTTDFVFAAVSFVPGIGWAISGIYTVVDVICVTTTGKKAVTYVNDKNFTRWVQFQNSLRNWINSLIPTGYYMHF